MFANGKTWKPSKEKNNRGPKETQKRQREQNISQRRLVVVHKPHSCCCRPRSLGGGNAGSSCLSGYRGCLLFLGTAAICRAPLLSVLCPLQQWWWWQGTLRGEARFRQELIQAACLQPRLPVLCVAKSYPGCGRKCPAGCFYVKSHLLLLFWIQLRGRGYKLAKSIGPLCLRLFCSS